MNTENSKLVNLLPKQIEFVGNPNRSLAISVNGWFVGSIQHTQSSVLPALIVRFQTPFGQTEFYSTSLHNALLMSHEFIGRINLHLVGNTTIH